MAHNSSGSQPACLRQTFVRPLDAKSTELQLTKVIEAQDQDVTIIGGASVAHQCLRAGLADELHVDLMPVLLGGGLRLFEDISADEVQLERSAVIELPGGRTHLKFRVLK